MFEKNILTFNPGWSSDAQPLREFTDVRELQRRLKARGVKIISTTAGEARATVEKPLRKARPSAECVPNERLVEFIQKDPTVAMVHGDVSGRLKAIRDIGAVTTSERLHERH